MPSFTFPGVKGGGRAPGAGAAFAADARAPGL
jgi:hypothetical protein